MKAEAVFAATLAELEIGEPVSRGGLHLFPITGGSEAEPEIVLLGEALGLGALTVEEVGEGGASPRCAL